MGIGKALKKAVSKIDSSTFGFGESFKKGTSKITPKEIKPYVGYLGPGVTSSSIKAEGRAEAGREATRLQEAEAAQAQQRKMMMAEEDKRRRRRLLFLLPSVETNIARATGRQELLGV